MAWSSGPCTNGIKGECADSALDELNLFSFNTPNWGLQDKAYGNTACGPSINYQIIINPGSSTDSYTNYFYVGWSTYPYCVYTNYGYNYYQFLGGDNLNTGDGLEEWYNINTNGVPVSGTVDILFAGGGSAMYTFSMPKGNPNIPINAWELVSVCAPVDGQKSGCNTNFSSGSGFFDYFQNHITVTSANLLSYTEETSNCLYASSPINYGSSVTQSMSC